MNETIYQVILESAIPAGIAGVFTYLLTGGEPEFPEETQEDETDKKVRQLDEVNISYLQINLFSSRIVE